MKLLTIRLHLVYLSLDVTQTLAAMQVVAGLSALTQLHLVSYCNNSSVTPRCCELACLRSPSLEDLDVPLIQVLEEAEATSSGIVKHRCMARARSWM